MQIFLLGYILCCRRKLRLVAMKMTVFWKIKHNKTKQDSFTYFLEGHAYKFAGTIVEILEDVRKK